MGIATPERVRLAWLGPGKLPDNETIEEWLAKAEREVRLPSHELELDARIEAEAAEVPPRTDLAEVVADVVIDMVIRKFQNPAGARSTSKGTGPFNRAMMFGGNHPGELTLTDTELQKLKPAVHRGGQISLIPSTAGLSLSGPPSRLVVTDG